MTFSTELKKWRGLRCQKQVNDIIGVSLDTYRKWEQGVNEPLDLAMEQVRWRMAADVAGVPVQIYRARYFSVIHKVAAEIMARK